MHNELDLDNQNKDVNHSQDNNSEVTVTEVLKIDGPEMQVKAEQVVVEAALTVYLNNKEFVTLVCTPSQVEELVVGFLCSEGIISHFDELKKVTVDSHLGLVWVETKKENTLSENLFLKRYITSCCGKGRTSFYYANDARMTKKLDSRLQVTSSDISQYINFLEEKSDLFHQTGGVHGGGIISNGKLEIYAMDIGRHNVLDKLSGWALIEGIKLLEKVIVFSGRISSEILIKTGKMGCPILIGVSAPTNLALELAEELGITVVGFARQNRMNIYTHPERVIISERLSF
ncbi:formate dehydrogenase accessory sulfurtransferase FdhD [Dehalobacter sp. DCM]|uniref:formate dehydrogenase accessory sulfurtransferase FdhD n=1 Tax=Dehalobacter sp. DCM TaxID=2907827 RepID=UPI0030819317|nr:formate dehydrogenase accessory sulfurtransferase FdhD [Dehalobacter sp. DCM]